MRHHPSLRGSAALVLVVFVVLTLTPAAQSPGRETETLGRELEQLEQRIAEESASWREFRASARSEEERAELVAAFPREEFVGGLTGLAARAAGTEVVARAWLGVFELACLLDDRELFARAIDKLVGEHVTSPQIGSLSLLLTYGAPAWTRTPGQAALRRILAGATDRSVIANALAQLALSVGHDALGEAGREEALALLARIEREYGSDDFIGMSGREFATGARHEIERLRVGAVAPDFEATDAAGTRFRLSDYRGRVVLLDFWGFV